MNFSDLFKKENCINEKNNLYKDKNNVNNLLKNGWSIIKKIKETNNITILNSKSTILLKEKINKEKIKNGFSKMISNWNEFRDDDIELRGDISPYFNYKEEINNIINEELKIQEAIKEINSLDNRDDYSSDEENNKHLIY